MRPGKSILPFFRGASKDTFEDTLPNCLENRDMLEGFFTVELIIRTYCELLIREVKDPPFILPFVLSPITPKQAVFLSVAIFWV